MDLVARLAAGDERAFETLVAEHYGAMIAVALSFVRTRAIAEEVVQDAWLAVLSNIGGFERRSSLRTWIMAIVANLARTRAVREARVLPFASLAEEENGSAVAPGRFRGGREAFPGHWRSAPAAWQPDEALLGRETLRVVTNAIEALPDAQRIVITMRDLAGCSPDEVCDALGCSDGNQRVLLHRARSRVRAALEEHLGAS